MNRGTILTLAGLGVAALAAFAYYKGGLFGNDQPGGEGSATSGGTTPIQSAGVTPQGSTGIVPNSAPGAAGPSSFTFLSQSAPPVLDVYTALNPGSQVYVAPQSKQGETALRISSGQLQSGGVVFTDPAGNITGGYNVDQKVSLGPGAALVFAQQAAQGKNPSLTDTGYTSKPAPNFSTADGQAVYVPPNVNAAPASNVSLKSGASAYVPPPASTPASTTRSTNKAVASGAVKMASAAASDGLKVTTTSTKVNRG